MTSLTHRFFDTLGSALRPVVSPRRRSVAVEPTPPLSPDREPQLKRTAVLVESPVEPKQLSLEDRVGQLYSQACRLYPTYEVMVAKGFSESMRKVFGNDEQGNEDAIKAFEYAREEFGYLSTEEQERLDAENAANGICSHGLDYDICPCGCGSL